MSGTKRTRTATGGETRPRWTLRSLSPLDAQVSVPPGRLTFDRSPKEAVAEPRLAALAWKHINSLSERTLTPDPDPDPKPKP